MEAVLERMELKTAFARENCQHARPMRVNDDTSGLSISGMTLGAIARISRHFSGRILIQPRYMRLLELIPMSDTDPSLPQVIATVKRSRLGQGTVMAKTPFVANRIGVSTGSKCCG